MFAMFSGNTVMALTTSSEGYPEEWNAVPIERYPEPWESVLPDGTIVEDMEKYRDQRIKSVDHRPVPATMSDLAELLLLFEVKLYEATGVSGEMMALEGTDMDKVARDVRTKSGVLSFATNRSKLLRDIKKAKTPASLKGLRRKV